MASNPNCLFPIWQQQSLPKLHTSQFWPYFGTAERQQFLASAASEPQPTRPLDRAGIQNAITTIQRFCDHLDTPLASIAPCRDEYRAFEQRRLTTLKLIAGASNPVDTASLNDQLHGSLTELRQLQVIAYLKQRLTAQPPASPVAAEARQTIIDLWADVTPAADPGPIITALNTHRRHLQTYSAARFGFVKSLLSADQTLDALATSRALRAAIQHLFGPNTSWNTTVDPTAPNTFTDPSRQTISIPANQTYSREHVRKLIIHEVGVHAARSINGSHSHEPLAAYGLAGYNATEEALGVLLQNAHKATWRPTGVLVPLAIIDFSVRLAHPTFRDIWMLTRALLIALDNPTPAAVAQTEASYAHRALTRTLRIYRLGTADPVDRSATKYWRGLLLLQRYFDTHGLTAATLDRLFLGKYDCHNPEQLKLITKHAT